MAKKRIKTGLPQVHLTPHLTKNSKSPAASIANSVRIVVLVTPVHNTRSIITVKREVLQLGSGL